MLGTSFLFPNRHIMELLFLTVVGVVYLIWRWHENSYGRAFGKLHALVPIAATPADRQLDVKTKVLHWRSAIKAAQYAQTLHSFAYTDFLMALGDDAELLDTTSFLMTMDHKEPGFLNKVAEAARG